MTVQETPLTLSLICASHTPMLTRVEVDPGVRSAVASGFAQLAAHMRAFEPDLIIQFAPDHFQGFYYKLMPSFCVGLAARSAADWDIAPGTVDVPEADAAALVDWLIDKDFDVAFSRDMTLDHGFLQMWQEMLGSFEGLPIVPIFINCAAPPLPTYRRIRRLGEAVGRFALETGKRVLISASGGLSHDPPVPDVTTAPPEVRQRLIRGESPTPEQQSAREAMLAELGVQAGRGEGPCQPLNPDWDKALLAIIERGDIAAFDAFEAHDVRVNSGRAANEVLAWVAASAAFSMAGPYEARRIYYEPIPEWIAGMAMLTGTPK